jgi:hypothetical protein
MLWRFLGVFCLISAVPGRAFAQTVPPAPAPAPETVVEEQHPIQVGDVIMAPRIEEPEDQPESVPPPAKARHWYGAPILLADGVAYGSILLAFKVERTSGVALPLGIGTYLLAGPITHTVHRRWGRMGLSLAARAVLPLVGVTTGVTSCNSDRDCSSTLALLTAGGMLAASIIDAAVLAYEPIADSVSVQPALSVAQDRVWLGASGTF